MKFSHHGRFLWHPVSMPAPPLMIAIIAVAAAVGADGFEPSQAVVVVVVAVAVEVEVEVAEVDGLGIMLLDPDLVPSQVVLVARVLAEAGARAPDAPSSLVQPLPFQLPYLSRQAAG